MLSCEGADFSKVLKRYDIDLQVEMTPQEMAEKLLPADPVFHKVAEEVMYMRFKTVGPVVAEAIKVKDPLRSSTTDSSPEWRSSQSCTPSTYITCLRS